MIQCFQDETYVVCNFCLITIQTRLEWMQMYFWHVKTKQHLPPPKVTSSYLICTFTVWAASFLLFFFHPGCSFVSNEDMSDWSHSLYACVKFAGYSLCFCSAVIKRGGDHPRPYLFTSRVEKDPVIAAASGRSSLVKSRNM